MVATLAACGGDGLGSPDGGADTDASPTSTGVDRIDLTDIADGESRTVSIGEHTLGFHVVVALDDGNYGDVGIERIDSPSGQPVVEDFLPTGAAVPVGTTPYGLAALSVPMTSDAVAIPVEAGDWTITFSTPPGRSAHASIYVRSTADGQFHGGTLDVRIYIPEGLEISDPEPAHVVTPESAASDPCVQARVDSFYATLDELFQLERGSVEFLPLSASSVTILDDTVRLEALEATTAPEGAMPVHFVWTNDLELFGTKAWGNTAWVPGTATSAGHPLAGIVVDISSTYPAAADGMTMLHELGHFLGLFHTTEVNPAYHDLLSDTAECATNQPSCPDAHNIMFPTFYGATGGVDLVASDHQRRVVWGSPIYTAADPE